MKTNRLEGAVLSGIMHYLFTRQDLWFWRNNTAAMAPRAGAFIRFGKKGAADILGVHAPAGRLIGIEVKREVGGVLSADQEMWGANLTAFGGLYIVARDPIEVRQALGEPTVRIRQISPHKVYPK